ncbi:MAG: phosphosulfolactate synthase [Actinomycetota bacterium]|nr:phosphosulfolactate synthase [Actinomycetota bacterium]
MTTDAEPTFDYIRELGVPELPPAIVPFDPGYDVGTVTGHLEQSHRFMAGLKLSMATWMIADPNSTRQKIAAARSFGVATVAGGGPFEVAAACGTLDRYLDLCASMGITRIEAASGFTQARPDPAGTLAQARDRGLEVQFELGRKHDGPLDAGSLDDVLDEGRAWLDAGASDVVVEARESARNVGIFDADGNLQDELADRIGSQLGLERVVFEAPDKRSQFSLLDHFGPHVQLGNVRLEEILRVEIYRRGLHSDSFSDPRLAPGRAPHAAKSTEQR